MSKIKGLTLNLNTKKLSVGTYSRKCKDNIINAAVVDLPIVIPPRCEQVNLISTLKSDGTIVLFEPKIWQSESHTVLTPVVGEVRDGHIPIRIANFDIKPKIL